MIKIVSIETSYFRNHQNSLTVDGHDINLDVGTDKKHAETLKFFEYAFQFIHKTMKQFSVGKSYDASLKYDEICLNFIKTKLFKTLNFCSYFERVIKIFIWDYKILMSAFKQDPVEIAIAVAETYT